MFAEVELSELEDLLKKDALLVDCREQEEVDAGAIEGMVHWPLSDLESYKDQCPTDRPILFYCRSGIRSITACEIIADWTDQPRYSLKGGILGYNSEL